MFDLLSRARGREFGEERAESEVAEVTSGAGFPGHREAGFRGPGKGKVFTAAGLPGVEGGK